MWLFCGRGTATAEVSGTLFYYDVGSGCKLGTPSPPKSKIVTNWPERPRSPRGIDCYGVGESIFPPPIWPTMNRFQRYPLSFGQVQKRCSRQWSKPAGTNTGDSQSVPGPAVACIEAMVAALALEKRVCGAVCRVRYENHRAVRPMAKAAIDEIHQALVLIGGDSDRAGRLSVCHRPYITSRACRTQTARTRPGPP